ncbi:serine/threonine-protein kinase [Archangium gephyra]|uniref:Serine/threonine protein kinase PrkC, regulator of stationary phase n=1 Tax=Archangium gephyra TaxID=48 RepID=A0AAC8TCA7_9BACT|nr:protein kinase [Archangium gephyra]AKJ00567.1 Serine/threonine protein kinase PrkC, regulator of stationary phase [Archangium gephyra]REG32736.1 serine/threonine-protein kinase [Archangium gephyra]
MTATQPMIPLSWPAMPSRRFGKYVLIRKLAEGGMAEIFLAKQLGAEGFERDVVIKCMHEHLTQHREFVSMFLDEARLAARLHHPNIVQITDLGMADNRYFICMEYLAGEDLEAVFGATQYQGQGVPIPIAARIILSALEGLEFAHGYQEQGRPLELVHRDISPSNIFVTYQGTVKVLDFGIAKASSRMTQTQPGFLKGKWGYMSPEQARGDQQLDGRSDLFSLGVTFHELLTMRRVFERDTELGVLLALMDQPIPPPSTHRPDVPPALDRIVMKALERRREDRYASAAEMRADLEEFLRGTASIPGVSQLAQYLQGVFGAANVERKTKIPSLSELGAHTLSPQQEEPLGTEKTLVRPSVRVTAIEALEPPPPESQRLPTGPALAAVPNPVPVPASPPPARSTGLSVAMGAFGAVALLALGGGAVWYLMPRAAPPAPVTAVSAPVPGPAPKVEPTPTPASPTPTPSVEQKTEPPPPAAPKPAPMPSPLTARDVNRVMVKNSRKILECGEQFRTELPADRRVMLLVTIAHSGDVSAAKVAEPATVSPGLAKCLEGQMKRVVFPRNTNQPELTIQLPLRFNEQ